MVSLIPALLACSTMNFLGPTGGTGGNTASPGTQERVPTTHIPTSGGNVDDKFSRPHAKPRLIADHNRLVAGQTNTLAIVFDIDPHWHMYWPGVNDSGIPAAAEFKLPEGFTQGAWQWPAPHERQVLPGDIVDHIYENRFAVLVPITVPADAKAGPITIAAEVRWMVCADGCALEHTSVELTVDIAAPDSQAKQGASETDELIRQTRARLPVALPEADAGASPDGVLSYRVERAGGSGTHIVLKAEKARHIAFYPEEGCLPLTERLKGSLADSGLLDIQFGAPSRGSSEAGEGSPGIRGVIEVRLENESAPRFYRIARPFLTQNAGQGIPSLSHSPTHNR